MNSSVSRFTYHHFNNLGDSIPEQADPNYLTLTVGTLSICSNIVAITSITLFITQKLMQRLGVGIYICSCRVQMSKLFRSRRYIIQIKEECGDQLVVNLASPASYKLEKVRAQRIVAKAKGQGQSTNTSCPRIGRGRCEFIAHPKRARVPQIARLTRMIGIGQKKSHREICISFYDAKIL